MDAVHAALADRPNAYLIALAGIPGSGKSTLSRALQELLPGSAILPMDGYHLPSSRLTPEQMHRRGAPDTFDASALRRDLEALRRSRRGSFPAFDHAVKDPEPNAIRIGPETRPIFVEGLYLLLRDWKLEPLFDVTIFLECDVDLAMRRVAQRHVDAGICATREEAESRVEANDRRNALLILGDGCPARADLRLHLDPSEPPP